MTEPPTERQQLEMRLMWLTHGSLWCETSRSLLRAADMGSWQLAPVALEMCLAYCEYVNDGHGQVRGDMTSRAACPIDPRAVRKQRARFRRMRNVLLHFGDRDSGQVFDIEIEGAQPVPIITISTRAGGREAVDSFTATEAMEIVDTLQPWLDGEFARLATR